MSEEMTPKQALEPMSTEKSSDLHWIDLALDDPFFMVSLSD